MWKFFPLFALACMPFHEMAIRQARIDFPGCVYEPAGTYEDSEELVRILCPAKAPFVAAYDVYPTGAVRKR